MLPLVSPVDCPAAVYFVDLASTPAHPINLVNLELPSCLSQRPNSLLQLDFGDLPSFTTVHDQYQAWGVALSGAVAIRPSNPAFADAKRSAGLMPARSHQPLGIQFQQARQLASLSLAGAQQIILKAYDDRNRLVAEQQVGQTDYRQSHQAATCIRHQVQLAAQAISRIEICSSAPFLLFGLVCG